MIRVRMFYDLSAPPDRPSEDERHRIHQLPSCLAVEIHMDLSGEDPTRRGRTPAHNSFNRFLLRMSQDTGAL